MAESQLRPDLTRSPAVSVGRGPAAGAVRRLVRDGAAQPGHDRRPARHVQGLHRAPARRRGDGLRRGLFHADPSDRHDQPQGPQQCGDGGGRRSRQSLRHRRRRGRPRCRASGIGHAGGFPRLRRGLQAARHGGRARLRRCNARPIIPGSSSIRNGSSAGPTARCAMRKTRRRNTRTSSTPISAARTPARCGMRLRDVVLFWIEQGVKIFRVDNPHTKPFPILGMADP